MKKTKFIFVKFLFLIILVLSASSCTNNDERAEEKPFFLKCLYNHTFSKDYLEEEYSNIIQLVFVDNKDKPSLQEFVKNGISFKDSNLEIDSYEIKKGSSFGNIALYNLDVLIKKIDENTVIKQLELIDNEGKTINYPIGHISLNVVDKFELGDINSIDLFSHTGYSSALKDYFVDFELISDDFKALKLKKIDCGEFEKIVKRKLVTVNDVEYDFSTMDKDMIFSKNDKIKITVEFSEDDDYNYYVFSPFVVFSTGDTDIKLENNYATFALKYDDKKMQEFEEIFKGGNNVK